MNIVLPFIHDTLAGSRSLARSVLVRLQMPFSKLLKDTLSSRLDNISMARDDTIEVPLLNLSHAAVESRSIRF